MVQGIQGWNNSFLPRTSSLNTSDFFKWYKSFVSPLSDLISSDVMSGKYVLEAERSLVNALFFFFSASSYVFTPVEYLKYLHIAKVLKKSNALKID